jgi:hypothetical protein
MVFRGNVVRGNVVRGNVVRGTNIEPKRHELNISKVMIINYKFPEIFLDRLSTNLKNCEKDIKTAEKTPNRYYQ